MATKRTKIEEPAIPVTKAPPKRKVAVRPGLARAPKAETPAPAAIAAPAKKKAAKAAPAPAKATGIPTEVIALRAYFIAEARKATGQPGDETTDWLEAESQLRSEIGA